MKKNILKEAKRIHLIGIGGIGVSGLAKLLMSEGKKISGSDNNFSPIIKTLKEKGVKIFIPQKEENITEEIELVIFSQAILPDNPEYKKALKLKIPLLSYPEAVGLLMREKRGIAVAGTHGKTTTSSLIVSLLRKNKFSPSFLVGGEIIGLGNSSAGKGDFLIVEACEYKKSFLNYFPEIGVITNIERDHLDYYKNISEIKKAFREFLENVDENGVIIYCEEDKNTREVVEKVKKEKISYGLDRGDVRAKGIIIKNEKTEFTCVVDGKDKIRIGLNIWGLHNIQNTLASIGVGLWLGLSWSEIKEGIESFKGVHRRCEIIGEVKGVLIIDDYGHHPTEIKATLRCIREVFPQKRLIVVFQPHQYSRTRFLLKEFSHSFILADKVVVPDIYFVRDSIIEKKLVNAEMLVERIRRNGKEALYLPTFDEIIEYLVEIVKPGDIVLTIGAGPVDYVGKTLFKRLREK